MQDQIKKPIVLENVLVLPEELPSAARPVVQFTARNLIVWVRRANTFDVHPAVHHFVHFVAFWDRP